MFGRVSLPDEKQRVHSITRIKACYLLKYGLIPMSFFFFFTLEMTLSTLADLGVPIVMVA